MQSDWLIEEDFDRTGAYQMERDEALARARIDHPELPSVLRLYSWQPPALSLGYQQKSETIDFDACEKHGIDVVRRPTGGRAVLHKNELTYAVITRASAADGLYAIHNRIISALLRAIVSLSPTGMAPLTITERSASEKTVLPVACFVGIARHEVTWEGKKVIGSAQRRFGEVVLQHGSILLRKDHLLLPELLAISSEEKICMRETLEGETATLSDVFGRQISIEECALTIERHFTLPNATLTRPQSALFIA